MKTTVSVADCEMTTVRDHYLQREATHRLLRSVIDEGDVHDYVQLALGVSNPTGNYSAAEHQLGPRILASSTESEIFKLAQEIDACDSVRHLPTIIYKAKLTFVRISVGTEIALMLRPNDCWVGNIRTYWVDLLLKYNGNRSKANEALSLYRDGDRIPSQRFCKSA